MSGLLFVLSINDVPEAWKLYSRADSITSLCSGKNSSKPGAQALISSRDAALPSPRRMTLYDLAGWRGFDAGQVRCRLQRQLTGPRESANIEHRTSLFRRFPKWILFHLAGSWHLSLVRPGNDLVLRRI